MFILWLRQSYSEISGQYYYFDRTYIEIQPNKSLGYYNIFNDFRRSRHFQSFHLVERSRTRGIRI
jgi:hypothetical protein